MIKLQIFALLSLFTILDAANLPTYLTRCRISDPNISVCIKKNGNKAIRDIAKGDIHYDIRSVLPLKVQGPIVSKENYQEIVITDLQIHGLETANISEMEFDLEKGVLKMTLDVPVITVLANCDVIGINFESNRELLNEKFHGAIINFISDFSVGEIDGEMYFTKFEHYYKFQSEEQNDELYRTIVSLKGQPLTVFPVLSEIRSVPDARDCGVSLECLVKVMVRPIS
ncbi:uncharacterized protein CBL_05393 [Carabus blaptoides fortunei]